MVKCWKCTIGVLACLKKVVECKGFYNSRLQPRCTMARTKWLVCVFVVVTALAVFMFVFQPLVLHLKHNNNKSPHVWNGTTIKANENIHRRIIHVVTTTKDTKTILDDRKTLVDKTCRSGLAPSGTIKYITGNRAMNVSYCVIPKAGCTMWLRIFKFLAGQKRSTGNPLSISKFEIHYRETDKYNHFHFKEDNGFIMDSWRVMTVRDPFTRLWSAYIDKLLLPDFWKTKGKMIVKLTRPGATSESLKCGNDVTFPEFIEYVIQNGHDLKHVGQDSHWLPASDICDPCTFKPDVIGKQETFLDDMTYVLQQTNKSELLERMKSTQHTEYEIEDEVKYNYNIYDQHKGCISIVGLCKRMWMAFTLNGYIPSSEAFPKHLETLKTLSRQLFLSVIRNVRSKHNVTRDDTKRMRRQALIQAYSSIPRESFSALQKLYDNDFKLFGYNKLPEYITQ